MNNNGNASLETVRLQVSFSSGLHIENMFLQGWFSRPSKQRQSWVRSLLAVGITFRRNGIGYDWSDYPIKAGKRSSYAINLVLNGANPDDRECLEFLSILPANRRAGWARDTMLWGFDFISKLDQYVLRMQHVKDGGAVVQHKQAQRVLPSVTAGHLVELPDNDRIKKKKLVKTKVERINSEKSVQNTPLKVASRVGGQVKDVVNKTTLSGSCDLNEATETNELSELSESTSIVSSLDIDEPSASGFVGLDLDLSKVDDWVDVGESAKSDEIEPPLVKLEALKGLFRLT